MYYTQCPPPHVTARARAARCRLLPRPLPRLVPRRPCHCQRSPFISPPPRLQLSLPARSHRPTPLAPLWHAHTTPDPSPASRGASTGTRALLGGAECGEQAKCPHEPRDPPNYQNVTLFFLPKTYFLPSKRKKKPTLNVISHVKAG